MVRLLGLSYFALPWSGHSAGQLSVHEPGQKTLDASTLSNVITGCGGAPSRESHSSRCGRAAIPRCRDERALRQIGRLSAGALDWSRRQDGNGVRRRTGHTVSNAASCTGSAHRRGRACWPSAASACPREASLEIVPVADGRSSAFAVWAAAHTSARRTRADTNRPFCIVEVPHRGLRARISSSSCRACSISFSPACVR